MKRCAAAALWVLVVLTAGSNADGQTINGVAEWTASRGTSVSENQASTNNAIWQLYSIGYDAPVLDPRLMKFNTSVSFRSNSLDLGGDGNPQPLHGTQGGLGYTLGASLFPSRPFPFYFQASRDIVNESSAYPSSSSSRAGLVLPADTPLPDFQTTNQTMNVGWQLNTKSLPRIELSYRTGTSTVTGGPLEAQRNDTDLHAGVFKDTKQTRQSLRFEKSSYDNAPFQAFDQRVNDINYEFTALVGARSRFVARSGRRHTFSLFDLQPVAVDVGKGSYSLPSQGEVSTSYVTTGMTWEPAARLSVDVSGGFDRQDAGDAALTARLASASTRFDVFRGFSLTASGVYGDRGQFVGSTPVRVTTRSGVAGATYRVGPRWLEATVVGSRAAGLNDTPEGQRGEVRGWSGQAMVSSTWRWIGITTGYDRAKYADDILIFGNYEVERTHWSAQHGSGALSLSATFDDAVTVRGTGSAATRTRQDTLTETATLSTRRGLLISANAGSFRTNTGGNVDRTLFFGGSYDMRLTRALHLTVWARSEHVLASQTALDQQNFYALASAEYSLRLLKLAFEYRHNEQQLVERNLADPFRFHGHQIRIRMTRTFSIRR